MPPKRNVEDEREDAPRRSNLPETTRSSQRGAPNSHIEILRVRVSPASAESDVIPTVEEEYVFPNINREMLEHPRFDVENIGGNKNNGMHVVGTDETFTDTLVDGLLRIVELDGWPLRIRNYPLCRLYIADSPRVSSDPEFVDKHLQNVRPTTGFGESQISVACAMRIYADIPAAYWRELEDGVPQNLSVEVQRWPRENTLSSGFDLAQPAGRQAVLKALVQIRESLLNDDD
ncbi:8178_t:CDS:2 [Paraglomus occultum]|uniref:8178_t:CDS:1 n=1 Tax=Paraglomus occultum TaxID=144539 RepID=A0A9N9FR40_9GLOM|nr:8178_t:CDS:2 [Paraglomus occultum]